MKLKLIRETLLLTIFLLQKVTKNQKMTKGPCSETTREFLAVNPQTGNATYMWFSGLFQFLPFFGHFLSDLERKTKFIKIWTKFQIKQVKFLPPRYTSLLLRSEPVQQNWLRFLKNFIDNIFALESEKESKKRRKGPLRRLPANS